MENETFKDERLEGAELVAFKYYNLAHAHLLVRPRNVWSTLGTMGISAVRMVLSRVPLSVRNTFSYR